MGGVWDYSITYIRDSDLLKKTACLLAGLGHLQPLLLATTNANYLLDRFCMERCCSSDYISRIVTSIIFMEILSIILVRIVLYVTLRNPSAESQAKDLVEHTRKEEKDRDIISITILWAIFLGYVQIFYAFTTGGKKGHMHWFYTSLLIQHFLNSLIAGSIGFWDVGLALWYLVTLPMGPVVVFFYQLIIHSWIRNNGPRDAEYLVVEYQIWLALCLSCIATIFWTIGYGIPHISTISPKTGTTIDNLNTNPSISKGTIDSITLQYENSSGSGGTITLSTDSGTVNVKVTLTGPKEVNKYNVTIAATITSKYSGTITVYNRALKVNGSNLTLTSKDNTITVTTGGTTSGTAGTTTETLTNNTVTVKFEGVTVPELTGNGTYTYKTFYPNRGYYISQTSTPEVWKEEWDGGRCFYAEYYKNGNNHALLKLCILGNTLTTKYYGKGTGNWKIINSSVFSTKLDLLQRTGTFNIAGSDGEAAEDQSEKLNTDFTKVLCDGWTWDKLFTWAFNSPTPTWYPLLMQGLSVGAVGSIFPNLIPKTLTCPKTTRTLTVMNMFIVTVPHIFNVMLGDMDCLSYECSGTSDLP